MSVGEIESTDTATVELDKDPARVSSVVSLLAGVLAVLLSTPFLLVAVPLGLAGVLFLGAGLFAVGSRRYVSLGVTSLFVAVLLVGALGAATPLTLLLSAVAVFVSWDTGQRAVTIGEQFGTAASTQRGEMVHAAASSLIGVVAAGVSYAVYLFGTGGQPALAIVLLILGVVGIVWALRD